jgi:hypothetical protein
MPEFNQNYNFNSLYFLLLLFIYNIWNSNYEYINIVLNKLYLLNYISLIIIINIIGLYLILRNLSFEVNIKYTIKYNV